MTTPFWQRLLADDESIIAIDAIGRAVLADAGDPAVRLALQRWNALRDDEHRLDAYASLAIVLAECFDDYRALISMLSDFGLTPTLAKGLTELNPTGPAATMLRSPVLEYLHHFMASESTEPPTTMLTLARHFRIRDEGQVYLPLRRVLMERILDRDEAERAADLALLAAVAAEPGSSDVIQTVLSYWNAASPLDNVPTADPPEGRQAASWYATCELIAHTPDRAAAEQLIELALDYGRAFDDNDDGRALINALSRTSAPSAEDHLFDLAKSELPGASAAVRAIAARRRRIAGVRHPATDRLELVLGALRESGIVSGKLGRHAQAHLLQHLDPEASALEIAMEALPYFGGANPDAASAWERFWAWADEHELPEPDPVPARQRDAAGEGVGSMIRKLLGRK